MKSGRAKTAHTPTPAEARLLKALWSLGEATVEQVVNYFPLADRPNYKTTHSFLRIMESKGFVEHSVVGKAFLFRPSVTEREVTSASVDTLLRQSFDGSVSGLMVNLIEAGRLKPADLHQLDELLRSYRRNQLGEPE